MQYPRDYLFFLGYPHSGHSLVGQLLNAHPEALVAHEADVFKHMGYRRLTWDGLVELLIETDQYFEQTHNRMWEGHPYRFAESYSYDGLQLVGDKKGGASTDRLYRDPGLYDELARITPGRLHTICVYRDWRQVSASLVNRYGWSQVQANSLVRQLDYQLDYLMGIVENPVYEVQYEDFCAEPKKHLAWLVSALGLGIDEAWLEHTSGFVRPASTWE